MTMCAQRFVAIDWESLILRQCSGQTISETFMWSLFLEHFIVNGRHNNKKATATTTTKIISWLLIFVRASLFLRTSERDILCLSIASFLPSLHLCAAHLILAEDTNYSFTARILGHNFDSENFSISIHKNRFIWLGKWNGWIVGKCVDLSTGLWRLLCQMKAGGASVRGKGVGTELIFQRIQLFNETYKLSTHGI